MKAYIKIYFSDNILHIFLFCACMILLIISPLFLIPSLLYTIIIAPDYIIKNKPIVDGITKLSDIFNYIALILYYIIGKPTDYLYMLFNTPIISKFSDMIYIIFVLLIYLVVYTCMISICISSTCSCCFGKMLIYEFISDMKFKYNVMLYERYNHTNQLQQLDDQKATNAEEGKPSISI